MGIKTLLSKQGRQERALAKAVVKAGNSKIKPDDRRPALYALLENGSPEAVAGLLQRFTFNYDTNIVADEEEKNYVYDGLVELGETVLDELRSHLGSAPSLSWGLRLLKDVGKPDQIWEVTSEIASHYEPGYARDPTRKQQLLAFLSELRDERVAELVRPFLEDHDETVRYIAVEALIQQGDEGAAREALLERLLNEEEESLRLRNRIVEGFIERGWGVKGYRGAVEKALPSDVVVDGKGRIKRRKGKAS